ncbi:MAG: hypothetical protein ICV80_17905 [Microcoleus sp. T1-bin1]|nr:hypothetical protein [Microcoleus sp. T1-bin1]
MYNLTTKPEASQMNVQLLESLIQVILSLWADEQLALSVKILPNIAYPSTRKIVQLALS